MLAAQRLMVSPAERDATVHHAVATERALAAESQQRVETAWQEKLGVLERQLSHQAAEVQALRAANKKLEVAVRTLKVRPRLAVGQAHVKLRCCQPLTALLLGRLKDMLGMHASCRRLVRIPHAAGSAACFSLRRVNIACLRTCHVNCPCSLHCSGGADHRPGQPQQARRVAAGVHQAGAGAEKCA